MTSEDLEVRDNQKPIVGTTTGWLAPRTLSGTLGIGGPVALASSGAPWWVVLLVTTLALVVTLVLGALTLIVPVIESSLPQNSDHRLTWWQNWRSSTLAPINETDGNSKSSTPSSSVLRSTTRRPPALPVKRRKPGRECGRVPEPTAKCPEARPDNHSRHNKQSPRRSDRRPSGVTNGGAPSGRSPAEPPKSSEE